MSVTCFDDTRVCLVAQGVIEGSKEKEMLELSHTDYYQTIKSNSLVIMSSFVRCINLLITS